MRINHHLNAKVIYTFIAIVLEVVILISSIKITHIELITGLVPIYVRHEIKTIRGWLWVQIRKAISIKKMVVIPSSEKQDKTARIRM